MSLEGNEQVVGEIKFLDENQQQQENTQRAWNGFQFLVWLPVVFAVLYVNFPDSLPIFSYPLYIFLTPVLLISSLVDGISNDKKITLRRFGLSFLLGLIIMVAVGMSHLPMG